MSPDDPRHGTHRGYIAHTKDGEEPCGPCRDGHYRHCKRSRHRLMRGERRLVPLGARAHRIVAACPHTQLSRATGIKDNWLVVLEKTGPDAIVLLSTRTAILTADTWSVIGIQRRLQALATLGWSSSMLAEELQVNAGAISTAQTKPRQFIRPAFAEAVVRNYDRLVGTPPTPGAAHVATLVTARARRYGWQGPDAWDDIDFDVDPDPLPVDYIDEAVVHRILAGHTVPANPAERHEVVRRWTETGRSLNELERQTGWNTRRYMQEAS